MDMVKLSRSAKIQQCEDFVCSGHCLIGMVRIILPDRHNVDSIAGRARSASCCPIGTVSITSPEPHKFGLHGLIGASENFIIRSTRHVQTALAKYFDTKAADQYYNYIS
jgi:hypothetical protein